jgi:hypothetical protein
VGAAAAEPALAADVRNYGRARFLRCFAVYRSRKTRSFIKTNLISRCDVYGEF